MTMLRYILYILCLFTIILPVDAKVLGNESINYDSLSTAITMSAAGMKTQGERMKIIAQNVANADVTGITPGAEPYRRKIIYLGQQKDPRSKEMLVTTLKVDKDYNSPFAQKYDPHHPAANQEGVVLLPNINRAVEMVEAREADHSYRANLNILGIVRDMRKTVIGIIN